MSGTSTTITQHQRQFPCPQCGAKLEYAPGTDTLKCPYCGATAAIPHDHAQAVEELDYVAALSQAGREAVQHQVQVIHCAACGAQTTLGPDTTAGKCAFCGTPFVTTAQALTLIKPGSLLPFRIDRKDAFARLRAWMGSLWLAPGDLTRAAQTDEILRGVYVPYWTYDSDTTSRYTGERGDDYWETETYVEIVDGKPVTRTRQVVKTRWTAVSGTVQNGFDDVLVLASVSLPQRYAEALEPWDLQDLTPYTDEYLSGFEAQSYQVTLPQGFEVAKQIMDGYIRQSVNRDIGGDHQRIHSLTTRYDNVTFKHILLPIWISAYRYGGKVYRFLVNARTGEVQGERPWSAIKVAVVVVLVLVLIAVAVLVAQQGGVRY